MSNKAAEIATLLAPIVQQLGLELLGVQYLPASGRATLRVYIDVCDAVAATQTVSIEDCERVSREVSSVMDVENPITGQYVLEVSSPGFDRPLFSLEHFARHQGERVKVQLKLPQNNRRKMQGYIVEVSIAKREVTLSVLDEPCVIAYDNIENARIVPDWSALGLAPTPVRKPREKKKGPSSHISPKNSAADTPLGE